MAHQSSPTDVLFHLNLGYHLPGCGTEPLEPRTLAVSGHERAKHAAILTHLPGSRLVIWDASNFRSPAFLARGEIITRHRRRWRRPIKDRLLAIRGNHR